MSTFDARKTIAVISAYPNNLVTLDLIEWLHLIGIPRERIRTHTARFRDISCDYNYGVKHVALKTRAEQFIFADNDIRPSPKQTAPFLKLDADVVACEYEGEFPHEVTWGSGVAFHCGLWRCHRAVLETVKPPWFAWDYIDDGCDARGCPCQMFARKALDAGFSVRHGGWARHAPRKHY